MTVLRSNDLRQHYEVLRTRRGEELALRFVEPGDAEELQAYYRSLSARSRYNRFLGAMSELPRRLLEQFTHAGEDDSFTVIATMVVGGLDAIVGEVRYAFDSVGNSLEFGLSIDDRWQGLGIGEALLKNLECRAAAFGAGRIFGDTLRSNAAMIGLATKAGFAFSQHPDDWKLVRFEKRIDRAPADLPCVGWRIAAAARTARAAAGA